MGRGRPLLEREDVDAIFGVLLESRRLDRRFEETSRLLEQRIAYHRALIAREKARRQLPWYRRIFAA